MKGIGKIKPSIKHKRHSSLGFVEPTEQGELFKQDSKAQIDPPQDQYSKKISYKGSNIDFESGAKNIKKAAGKKTGKNRFEEIENESLAMPNQVIEEWIDETLKQDEEEKA